MKTFLFVLNWDDDQNLWGSILRYRRQYRYTFWFVVFQMSKLKVKNHVMVYIFEGRNHLEQMFKVPSILDINQLSDTKLLLYFFSNESWLCSYCNCWAISALICVFNSFTVLMFTWVSPSCSAVVNLHPPTYGFWRGLLPPGGDDLLRPDSGHGAPLPTCPNQELHPKSYTRKVLSSHLKQLDMAHRNQPLCWWCYVTDF